MFVFRQAALQGFYPVIQVGVYNTMHPRMEFLGLEPLKDGNGKLAKAIRTAVVPLGAHDDPKVCESRSRFPADAMQKREADHTANDRGQVVLLFQKDIQRYDVKEAHGFFLVGVLHYLCLAEGLLCDIPAQLCRGHHFYLGGLGGRRRNRLAQMPKDLDGSVNCVAQIPLRAEALAQRVVRPQLLPQRPRLPQNPLQMLPHRNEVG
mmetsp:Transcript_10575/g.31176  ORF Transcript_10575/g.31176 Transcript_10575/m.31176 type:complete len:206 (+) Transcript_10575:870-1487(+)